MPQSSFELHGRFSFTAATRVRLPYGRQISKHFEGPTEYLAPMLSLIDSSGLRLSRRRRRRAGAIGNRNGAGKKDLTLEQVIRSAAPPAGQLLLRASLVRYKLSRRRRSLITTLERR